MEKNSPINSVYVIAIATASIAIYTQTLYYAAIYSAVTMMTFLIALSIVSMIDRISDNHARFMMYTFICTILITVLKVLLGYFGVEEFVFASEHIEMTILPCLIMAIYPIYFENTLPTGKYFLQIVAMSFGFLFFMLLTGILTEILGYGTMAGTAVGMEGLEMFKQSYGTFLIIGVLAILFNIIRRTCIKRVSHFNMLVDKYKIIIREIGEQEKRNVVRQQSNKGGRK